MKTIYDKVAALEALRRERSDPALRNAQLTSDGADYATAGLLLQHALAALDEGLPSRQRQRVLTALRLAAEGLADLGEWAAVNGYYDPV